jgi:acyl-CoA thioesterase
MVDEQSPDAENPSTLVVEEVRIFDFDLATAVVPSREGFTATVDPGWTIGSRPNGGYLLALATRAALAVTDQPHPLAVSAHFIAPPSPGATELEVRLLRGGNSVANSRVTLVQDGQPRLEALVTGGRLERDDRPDWAADSKPPELAPVEECVRGHTELPGGLRVAIMDHLDVRLDPSSVGWLKGDPSGSLRMLGWVRFTDNRPPDPLAMLQVVDALPPASFELGILRWAPTVEMSVYIRALPADGWLRCAVRGKLLQGGWFDEETEVWDQHGRLVAQSRQLAGARPDPPARRPISDRPAHAPAPIPPPSKPARALAPAPGRLAPVSARAATPGRPAHPPMSRRPAHAPAPASSAGKPAPAQAPAPVDDDPTPAQASARAPVNEDATPAPAQASDSESAPDGPAPGTSPATPTPAGAPGSKPDGAARVAGGTSGKSARPRARRGRG